MLMVVVVDCAHEMIIVLMASYKGVISIEVTMSMIMAINNSLAVI